MRISKRNKCPDAMHLNRTYQFDWKMPPSKSSLPGKEKTVLIVRHFGAPPVIRLPRRHNKSFVITRLDRVIQLAYYHLFC